MKRRNVYTLMAISLMASTLSLPACDDSGNPFGKRENVLRVASWDEYICMGGEDSYYSADSKPIYEEFEDWYYNKTGKRITVEYVALQDNETMYNKIKMGDSYDLLCPSEYMVMKLATENKIIPFPNGSDGGYNFFDPTVEDNYYAQNVSPYIQSVFEGITIDGSPMSNYAAGYMWGTTGFVFNPQHISRETMSSWSVLKNKAVSRKITAKDNVRDSYFMGLGMYYENQLLSLKQQLKSDNLTLSDYQKELTKKMNDISVPTMNAVKKELEQMRGNLYGLETDEGKQDLITGRLSASYQWSGDAVYILDEAEEFDLELEYVIPSASSNLWFDGWVMMKDANIDLATAFVNYISMPKNVIRNMYYIGYTSCIGGNDIFEYLQEMYGYDGADAQPYDLNYFFSNSGTEYVLQTSPDQLKRQLFAQYPDNDTKNRLVVMNYFDKEANERANRMWNNIK